MRGARLAWVAAAAVLLAVLTPMLVRDFGRPSLPSIDTSRDVLRSSELGIISPEGDQAVVPAELRWNAIPGARSYRVRILEVDRTVIWQEETSGTVAELPGSVRRLMLPGKRLLWQVVALDSSSARLAESGLISFRLYRVQK